MNDRGYGFAWFAGYRLKCAQMEAIKTDLRDQIAGFETAFYDGSLGMPPNWASSPETFEDPLHGAMTLAYRAPNGDEVLMPKCDAAPVDVTPPGWAVRPATITCTAEDESDGTYQADWLKGFSRDDEGNFIHQTAPMFKHVYFDVTAAFEEKVAYVAPKKPRSILEWVRDLFRRR